MAGTRDTRLDPRTSAARCAVLVIGLVCALQAQWTFAGSLPVEPPAPPKPTDGPPGPSEQVSYDWIRLTSGEWLKGEILRLREESFEFKSQDLSKLVLKWSKIDAIHSPLLHTYLFEDMLIVSGPAAMQGAEIQIEGHAGVVKRARKELLSIVPGGRSEWDYWDGKLSANLGLTSGNTQQLELGANAFLRRSTALSRFRLDYRGNLSRVDGSENENNHRIDEKLDVLFSRRVFFTPLQFEALIDRFQNIDLRATPSLSLGYQLLDRPDLDWSANLGGGFQYTRFDSTLPGDSQSRYRGTLVFSSRFESQITEQLDLDASFGLSLPVPEVAGVTYHFLSTLSIELTDILDLDLAFVWDRVGEPATASDGTRPKRNDFRTSVGIGVEF